MSESFSEEDWQYWEKAITKWKPGDRVKVSSQDIQLDGQSGSVVEMSSIMASKSGPWWNVALDKKVGRYNIWGFHESQLHPEPACRRSIPTLEENQARLRQQQAEICKRVGYSLPAFVPHCSFEEMKSYIERATARNDRDYIANLARTALRSIDRITNRRWAEMTHERLADAKKAVELILAEASKP